MGKICVLVDHSAQFPNHSFPGQNLVRVIPFDVELNGIFYPEGKEVKVANLPLSARNSLNPRLIPPSPDRYAQWFQALSREFNEILVLTQSSHLSGSFQNALLASQTLASGLTVLVVNSQTTSTGLGILAQIAAENIERGGSLVDVEHLVRKQVSHIYTVICTPGLSYLYHAGIVDQAQSIVGELLNFIPVYTIEEERLTPLEKVRNYRSTIELFAEFLEEFEDLRHIALLQSIPPLIQESRSLRQIFQELYPNTTYSEHNLNLPTALVFGPRLVGLIAVENTI